MPDLKVCETRIHKQVNLPQKGAMGRTAKAFAVAVGVKNPMLI